MSVSEERIQQIGQELFVRMKGEAPGLFNKAWWSGQVMEWSMRDPDFKTEMFRFVDVFPVLDSPEEVYRHVQEYLLRPGLSVPGAIKVLLKGAGLGKLARSLAAGQIAKNLEGMAKGFIVGTDAKSALSTLKDLRKARQAFTVDLLGEATMSEAEAQVYQRRYLDLIEGLPAAVAGWKEDPLLDRDDRGAIPRVNISVKVSAMFSQLDALAFRESVEVAKARLLPLFQRAKSLGVFLNLDLEDHALKDLTFALFRAVMEDPSMAGYEHAGVVVQAYLRDSEADLRALIEWAKQRGQRFTVRLVKGAYWDYEVVHAQQNGWPSPVWLQKGDTDACFERLSELLLRNHAHIRTAIGSHNVRSLAHAMAAAERFGVPKEGYEIQCLYGMAEPIKAACVGMGHRVRVYAPVGELLPGMAYLVRRLLENTSNQSWLRMSFVEGKQQAELLAAPKPAERSAYLGPVPAKESSASDPGAFVNEPLTDLTLPLERQRFFAGLAAVERELGGEVAPVIGGQRRSTARSLERLDPSDGESLIARVGLASIEQGEEALARAKAAFGPWRDRPAEERAACLFRMARLMREKKEVLSAWVTRECGKPLREADAEIAEAIDFCEYYGRNALLMSQPRLTQRLLGEQNHLLYEPRGVALVIAPWNFPFAILCGMSVAALVTGNTLLMKPAEQSSKVASLLHQIMLEAGVPEDAAAFLPGVGEELGAHLVGHPEVATIAFTGSMAVGLSIWKQAGITQPGQAQLKRVVCEMGGKNAVVVDSDADLDEAVKGVLKSAFGYAGQKCSACSRAIVLRERHQEFTERLVEATRSLFVGPAAHPRTQVGPVIDLEAHERLARAIAEGEGRAKKVLGHPIEAPGHYIAPTIFTGVTESDPLAQRELFGPVLAVLEAETFEEALRIAGGTPYALTGGLFSRSPARIAQAKREMRVGNLYINRTITGAIVGRQPFGGAKMSGGGTKAGGPDYLLHFVDPRAITENTQRRGFAPEVG